MSIRCVRRTGYQVGTGLLLYLSLVNTICLSEEQGTRWVYSKLYLVNRLWNVKNDYVNYAEEKTKQIRNPVIHLRLYVLSCCCVCESCGEFCCLSLIQMSYMVFWTPWYIDPRVNFHPWYIEPPSYGIIKVGFW